MSFGDVSCVPFVSSKTQVFCKDTKNSPQHQIHLLGKDFLLTARVSSDSSMYQINYIFYVSGLRSVSLCTIANDARLFKKFLNMVNMTFVHF